MRSHFATERAGRLGATSTIFLVVLLATAVTSNAQIFGGRGLFGNKEAPLRTPTQQEIGTPAPISGRAEVVKGKETQFQIEAHSKAPGAAVEFLIRTFPSAGKIVSIVANPNQRNKAIVTYYADPSSSATTDAFAFAARYRDGRYSSAVRYDLDLVGGNDAQSDIMVPSELDFGTVLVGEEAVLEIPIRNKGNSSFERMIYLSPPWKLVEPINNKVLVLGGSSKVLKVAFKPEMAGETSYYFSLSRSKTGTCLLKGTGEDPFTVVSETVELTLNEESREREGSIELLNKSKRPILLAARGSTRLQHSLDKEYLLAPGKTTEVPVRLSKTDTAPFDGAVELFLDNGYAKSVGVMAPVVPGKLEIEIPNSITTEVLNFGQVEAGRSTERGIRVTNVGGVAVPLDIHLPAPFRLLNDPGTQLAPLASTNLTVGLYPAATQRGPIDVTMTVSTNDDSHPIRLLGNSVKPSGGVPANAPSSPPAATNKVFRLSAGNKMPEEDFSAEAPQPETLVSKKTPAAPAVEINNSGYPASNGEDEDLRDVGKLWYEELSPEAQLKMMTPLGFIARPLVQRDVDGTIREPEDLSVVETTSRSITLGWTAPADPADARFEVEVRASIFNPETKMNENVWMPYAEVEYDRIGRLVKAEVEGLQPMIDYEFRVLTVDGTGKSSYPSEAFVARTDLPMDWTWIYATLGLCIIGLVAWGVARVIKERRPPVYQTQYVDA